MAQRQRSRRVDSEIVQGKGSFVTIRRLTLEEAREYQTAAGSKYVVDDGLTDEENEALKKEFDETREIESRRLLSKFIISWDWVDDDGHALDQPGTNPEVFLKLTDLEFQFLSKALTDTSELEKKTSKR